MAIRRYQLYHVICWLLAVTGCGYLLSHHHRDDTLTLAGIAIFHFDAYSWLYSLLVFAGWGISTVYSYTYIKAHYNHRLGYYYSAFGYTLALVLAASQAGHVVVLGLLYLWVGYASYQLIGAHGGPEDRATQRRYRTDVLLPAVGLLLPLAVALVWVYPVGNFTPGNLLPEDTPPLVLVGLIALWVMGMGTNAVFPFHRWLPSAWSTPAPVTALLHSVASVNLGCLAFIKLATYTIGRDHLVTLSGSFWHLGWLMILLGLNAVWAAVRALKTQNMKQRFTYSTVSQISYILTGVLIGTQLSIQAAFLHMCSHSIAKMMLFFTAGYFRLKLGTVNIPDIAPYLPRARWAAFYIAVGGLSIAGIPWLAGGVSKELLLASEWETDHYLELAFLLIGSFINFMYIIPLVRNALKPPLPTITSLGRIPIPYRVALFSLLLLLIFFSSYKAYLLEEIL